MNIIPIQSRSSRSSVTRPERSRPTKVIAITSGKGGVGKTNVTSNLAIALSRQGSRVCIFDADTNLANINVVMGLSPRYTIEHLLSGEKTVDEILLEGPEGIMIVPAASGIAECAQLDETQRLRLIDALETLEDSFDYLLIDTAAGIDDSVLSFVQSAQYTILVISTEPTSLTDAFAMLRMLKRREHDRPAYVLVNMALNYANSMEVFKRFEAAVRKYLSMKVHYLGYITEDKAIKVSVSRQSPILLDNPDALASRCFTTLAAVLSKQFTAKVDPHRFSAWWKELADAEAAAPEAADTGRAPVGQPAPAPGTAPAAKPDHGTELQALGARAHALLADPAVEREHGSRFLDPLIEVYLGRFHRLPPQLADLEKVLNRTGPTEAELREWARIIEAYFERRFDKPLHGERAEREQREREARDRVLNEYRVVGQRLSTEQQRLDDALARLHDYITTELLAGSNDPGNREDRD